MCVCAHVEGGETGRRKEEEGEEDRERTLVRVAYRMFLWGGGDIIPHISAATREVWWHG